MAGRFPGANDLAEFWQLLEKGADAITDGRNDGGSWSGAVGDPDAEDVGIRRGAFVDAIDWFDSRFFRISPIEARTMDPQQRMLLETSWEALEDGGLDPETLRGSRTGVYAGIGGAEYRDLFQASNGEHNYLGTTGSVTVGRVSFALGLEGPALPVDMACASSLASVHQAVVALQRGEVDLALAGGVNAILSPGVSRFMMEVGMLSPTGHCRPFDASADGYVRGEGCGMVVLKRLSEAEADGDRIYAVIRGSAVNQNGASAGLTVPNGPAQERVMAEALSQAGASPSDVDYLEAHATGSQLGDPIELNAAASVYGKGRDAEHPLLVGSVKSNIGHIESAAGIAAFIKTVLSMNRGAIPKSLHIETPNPNFEWDQNPVLITSDKTAWPTNSARPPLAGVNAFGLSGTNAHVLVEGYPAPSADGFGDRRNRRSCGRCPTDSYICPLNGRTTFRSPTKRRWSAPLACCRFRASRKARSVNRQSAISRGSTAKMAPPQMRRCPIWSGRPVWVGATSRIAPGWSSAMPEQLRQQLRSLASGR